MIAVAPLVFQVVARAAGAGRAIGKFEGGQHLQVREMPAAELITQRGTIGETRVVDGLLRSLVPSCRKIRIGFGCARRIHVG